MNNDFVKQVLQDLKLAQDKLKIIDSLSNNLQKIKNEKIKNEGLYFIHQIIEADFLGSDFYNKNMSFSIQANKDLLVKIN